MQPVHKHDCETCVYLKTIEFSNKQMDLYYCKAEPTVVARWADGPSYTSGLCFALPGGPLYEALHAAILMGLCDAKGNPL